MHISIRSLFYLFVGGIVCNYGCHSNPYRQGHALYKIHCENCHMADGSGLGKLIPSLDSTGLFRSSPECLICLIRHGIVKNELTGQQMPGNEIVNNVEMANLVNYLRQEYAGETKAVTTEEVKTCLATCKGEE